jgi:Mn2+/Fe2+ NRAMP family transporter
MVQKKVIEDSELLTAAQAAGPWATFQAFLRLSGPGWLQSAITLGGGSLAGALYLGVVGGTSMMWMQLIAIIAGVVMLTTISYVTLSTGMRPFEAMRRHINPVLAFIWVLATITANMIFILPQFSLCFDACRNNLMPTWLTDDSTAKTWFSAGLAVLAFGIVLLNLQPGRLSKLFDMLLKVIVGLIVICFVLVVVRLSMAGSIDWSATLSGLIPNFSQWNHLAPDLNSLLDQLPAESADFWKARILKAQQSVMISSAATAVGINMTFLLPYSMLIRGWGKPFRGLAVWDLVTGMAIPFVIVTSCIVIASAVAFHAQTDEALLSEDPEIVKTSANFSSLQSVFTERFGMAAGNSAEQADQVARKIAESPEAERKLATAVVKPNTRQFGRSLEPLLGPQLANIVFGLGVLGMGFSTIIILMLINGYAFAELTGDFRSKGWRVVGGLAAGMMGSLWFVIWQGKSQTYLAIVASTFAVLLLPIAYFAFLLMMNHRTLLGEQLIRGPKRFVWNVLMVLSLLGAVMAAISQIVDKAYAPGGWMVVTGVGLVLLVILIGFAFRQRETQST